MDKNKFNIKVVPWRNREEFVRVYECAFSESLFENDLAVHQMAVWEARCWPSLPYAIEVTLLCLRSKVQDRLYETNKSACRAQEIEMMYANAVVRFVNLLVENEQNSRTKKRISYIAAEKNIPSWIVDIRHNATHGFNPTLQVLRMAYDFIMNYLDEKYWQEELNNIKCLKKTRDEKPMGELWHDYVSKMLHVVLLLRKEKKKFMPAVKSVLEKMGLLLNKPKTRKIFLNILARDFVTEDILPLVEGDKILLDSDMMSAATLPDYLQEFYTPLVHLVHKYDLIPSLLELLLLHQEQRRLKIMQAIVDTFVLFVLDLSAGKGNLNAARPFILKGTNLILERLLYSCARGYSHSARIVLERLHKTLKVRDDWAEEVLCVMSIKQGNTVTNQTQKRKFNDTFTHEDIECDARISRAKNNEVPKKEAWSFAPLDIKWEDLPLGHIFEPEVDVKKEEIKQEVTSFEESFESIYAKTEESKPVIEPPQQICIFSENPDLPTNLVYQQNG